MSRRGRECVELMRSKKLNRTTQMMMKAKLKATVSTLVLLA